MFFKKKPEQPIENEDDVETLVLRLETSTYTEDKIDTLKLLYEYSLNDPISTGTYSLNAVMDSMGDLEDISYNLQILISIFCSSYALEFTDLFLKKEDNITILIDSFVKSPEEVNQLLELMSNSPKFREKLTRCRNVSFCLINGLETDKYEVLMKVVPLSQDFSKQLIFEGIFEKLLVKLEDRYLDWAIGLIRLLLTNSHFNQNYFIETDWTKLLQYIELKPQEVFNLLICLLDETNGNVKYIKENVYRVVKFKTCVEKKQYCFIYSMIHNDLLYLKEFLNIYNDLSFTSFIGGYKNKLEASSVDRMSLLFFYILNNKVIEFSETDDLQLNSALLLLSEVLFYNNNVVMSQIDKYLSEHTKEDKDNEPSLESIKKLCGLKDDRLIYKLLLIFTLRESIGDISIQVNSITIDSIIYILFSYDSSKTQHISHSIVEIVYDDSQDQHLISFCVLVCLMYDIRLNFNNACFTKHLKDLRAFLSTTDLDSKFFFVDECVNILFDKINELIIKYSERCTSEDLLNYEKL